jgi:hypothetical protein
MKRLFYLIIIFFITFGISENISAQTQAVPTSRLGWEQAAPTFSEAQNYTYRFYANQVTEGEVLLDVSCAGVTSPFFCTAPFPPFTPGNHTLQVTASNLAGESNRSNTIAFTFVVTPAEPRSLRIVGMVVLPP